MNARRVSRWSVAHRCPSQRGCESALHAALLLAESVKLSVSPRVFASGILGAEITAATAAPSSIGIGDPDIPIDTTRIGIVLAVAVASAHAATPLRASRSCRRALRPQRHWYRPHAIPGFSEERHCWRVVRSGRSGRSEPQAVQRWLCLMAAPPWPGASPGASECHSARVEAG
jgi:hypothetical protein